MRAGVIRIVASFILVLAAIGGGYMTLATQERERVESANQDLVAATAQLEVERQRIGEQERASRTARRQTESEAKGKAEEAGKVIADAVKAADAQAAKATAAAAAAGAGSAGATKPYDGPIPASCQEYGGVQAIGCALLLETGFGLDQMPCLVSLWNKESGWNYQARNNSSGAYGIPQALPGSKMSSAGGDWATNPATQIKWGLSYIKGRYGTPCAAWQHSKATGWY